MKTSMIHYLSTLSKYFFAFLCFCQLSVAQAQDRGDTSNDKVEITKRDYRNETVEMADQFRADGKIYVVVAVILTVFVGIIVFLVLTERKMKNLEDRIEDLNPSKT